MKKLLIKIKNFITGTTPIKYTSLFANVGIGEHYLEKIGLKAVVANELLDQRANWYKELYPDCEMITGDISNRDMFNNLVRAHINSGSELVLASPPCQSHTLANSHRDPTDKRGQLFLYVLKFIEKTDPKFVMIENVPQWLDAPYGKTTIKNYITKKLEKLGYTVNIDVQNAADFGTPQNRRRAIVLASKTAFWDLPTPNKKQITLCQAIGREQSLEAGQIGRKRYHVAPPMSPFQAEVMKHTPTGKSAHDNSALYKPCNVDGTPSKAKFKCSFQRKEWDTPCNTILSDSTGVSGFRTVHPGRKRRDGTYSDARCLTVRELLIVTGIKPSRYKIPKKAADRLIRTVIGECFAPRHVLAILKCMPRK